MNRARHTSRRVRGAARLAALAFTLAAGTLWPARAASARPIPWKSMQFQYVADHKDLKDVLRDLGASENVMTWISPQVDGSVTGRFDESPQRFLQRMSDSFGFIWYYDGSVLRISGPNEARSATIGLTHASTEDLRRAFDRLGVSDPRFPVLYDDKSRSAIVSGPPRMVELASDVARLIDREGERSEEPEIRAFRLHYAWATDRTLTINGQSVVVPGVASVLRGMYPESQAANAAQTPTAPRADAYRLRGLDGSGPGASFTPGGNATSASNIPTVPALYGTGAGGREPLNPPLPASYGPAGVSAIAAGAAGAAGGGSSIVSAGESPGVTAYSDTPVIQPDSRNNAILIRARPENMPAFERLIASLDRRPGVVEIDASIIEISETGLKELGVDWRLHSGHFDIETGNGQQTQTSNPGSINPAGFGNPLDPATAGVLASPAGGVLTAVIGGAGRYLLTRISALQQTDNARITASPKVATLDNVEAVMDNKQTFYVPVQGYQAGDLFSISAGVSLRVLPSIVTEQGSTQIRMDVHIEDGQLTTQTVGQLPVVSNSTIDTQSLIDEGQSLLIAGYSVDQDDHAETAVPGLSKLPLIGGLFKFKHQQGQKFQRLFLLTPRIVSAASQDAPAPPCDGCTAQPVPAASVGVLPLPN